MSNPFVGEIRLFGGNFAPVGWALCQGQTMSIAENDVLFNLIGTTYGGNGSTTFNLPNLASRVPVHQGSGPGLSSYVMGEQTGVESVTLTLNQIPVHNHTVNANAGGASGANPSGMVLASGSAGPPWFASAQAVSLAASALGMDGGNQPHDNMIPFLTINFIISLFGIFPSQN